MVVLFAPIPDSSALLRLKGSARVGGRYKFITGAFGSLVQEPADLKIGHYMAA